MVSCRPRSGTGIECRRESRPRSSLISLPQLIRNWACSWSCSTRTMMSSTRFPDQAPLRHIVKQNDLLSGLLTFLLGDAARLDAVNLGLIHFDENVRHLLDFGCVIIWAEQRYGVAAAITQRW